MKLPSVLLVEAPPRFIALCETVGVSLTERPRSLVAMVFGLRCNDDKRLVLLEGRVA